MQTETQSPERLFDYEVTDSTGNKVGTVDGVWVDDATAELEFIGVKTGWLLGKTHVIPAAEAQIGEGSVTVPYSEEQIKGAPSFGTDTELTPEQEDEIYSYYGLDRSTAPSPTGLATGSGTSDFSTTGTGMDTGEFSGAGTATGGFGTADTSTDVGATTTGATSDFSTTGDTGMDTGYTRDLTGEDQERVRLHEENLQVGKQSVEAGRARIRKVVRTDHVSQPVDLAREEVQIERIPASGDQVADDAFQEEQIDVPVMREEPVVGKEAHVTGEVRVGKTSDTETRTVEGEVRREDVEVDRGSGFGNTR